MQNKIKAVFDTNIYISAIIFGGNPRQCLELARDDKIILFLSKPILLELSSKLQIKFKWEKDEVEEVIRGLSYFTKIIEPKIEMNFIKEDKADNRILEAALEAKVDFIVSGDKKHLLSLKKFKNVSIVSSKEFLDNFFKKN